MEAKKLSDDEKKAIESAYNMHDRAEFLKRIYEFINDRVSIAVDYALKQEELNRLFLKDMERFKEMAKKE